MLLIGNFLPDLTNQIISGLLSFLPLVDNSAPDINTQHPAAWTL